MIRVLLVDDQALVRAGLRLILGAEDDIAIVGECADGEAALAALAGDRPDVIMMDVRMRVMDGVEATRRIRALPDGPPVLILTTFGDDETLSAALRAGAVGFILKDAPAADLIRATRTVAGGGAWLDPAVTGRVLATYRAGAPSPPGDTARIAALTPRETEVLRLIGRGATNTEIGDRLFIGEATVKSHVGHILDKLALRDRAAAIVFAFDNGMVRAREDTAP